jgi:hypothetical protein
VNLAGHRSVSTSSNIQKKRRQTTTSSKLCTKNLIITKSLHGFKSSAAGFHEYLAESLLHLGFTKTKNDNDIWMINNASHYEYLATYIDDILI